VVLDQISEGLRNLITMVEVYNAVFFLFRWKQIQPVDALRDSFQFTDSDPIAATD